MKMMRLALGMAAILIADSATTAEIHRNVRGIPESTTADQIEFQVLSDKFHYAPGTLVSVKFIVIPAYTGQPQIQSKLPANRFLFINTASGWRLLFS
jgi:hypothetical protein